MRSGKNQAGTWQVAEFTGAAAHSTHRLPTSMLPLHFKFTRSKNSPLNSAWDLHKIYEHHSGSNPLPVSFSRVGLPEGRCNVLLRARLSPPQTRALQAGLRKQELPPPRPPDPRPSLQPHHLQPITWAPGLHFPHFSTTALFLSPARQSLQRAKPHLVSEASK